MFQSIPEKITFDLVHSKDETNSVLKHLDKNFTNTVCATLQILIGPYSKILIDRLAPWKQTLSDVTPQLWENNVLDAQPYICVSKKKMQFSNPFSVRFL